MASKKCRFGRFWTAVVRTVFAQHTGAATTGMTPGGQCASRQLLSFGDGIGFDMRRS
jgi:hypothetical protein